MTVSTFYTEVRRALGGITSTDYSDANILISINRYIHDFEVAAIMASGSWEVQGEISTTNIVSGQAEYVFPNDLISLKKIEINPTGDSNGWSWASIHDLRNNITPLSNNTGSQLAASPVVDVYDHSIFLRDLPTANVSAGLKIYYSKEQTDLVNTYDETSFPEFLNTGLVYGACFDFALGKKLDAEIKNFKTLLDEYLVKVEKYYANRLPAIRPRIKAATERYD